MFLREDGVLVGVVRYEFEFAIDEGERVFKIRRDETLRDDTDSESVRENRTSDFEI